MSKFILIFATLLCCLSNIHANGDRIYIDEDEMCCEEDAFWIHIGGNQWIHTDTIHRDRTGLYTHECNIARQAFIGKDTPKPGSQKPIYEKSWKCPYCHMHWALGTACKNEDCPSRYK